ncbi:MAG: hypothetical protein QXT14_08280 [Candidatus Bathyarchaeia archaeon]
MCSIKVTTYSLSSKIEDLTILELGFQHSFNDIKEGFKWGKFCLSGVDKTASSFSKTTSLCSSRLISHFHPGIPSETESFIGKRISHHLILRYLYLCIAPLKLDAFTAYTFKIFFKRPSSVILA